MNVLSVHTFTDEILARLRAGMPGAVVTQYARLADVPPDVLAATDILYTAQRLPLPAQVPNLRWMQGNMAGVDFVVNQPLFVERRDVRLTTSAGVHAINMAEYILMMMLNLAHRSAALQRWRTVGSWPADRLNYQMQELAGATVGLIGYGSIGARIARLCAAFDMRVMATRSARNAGDAGVTWVDRDKTDAILRQADFVVICAPLTTETRGMIDAAALAKMKPGAYLINIARGAIIDEPALIEALRANRIAGAALDVFDTEPLPDSSLFWTMENVLMTPHISGVTPNYQSRVADIFIENYRRFVAGEPLMNEVDFERGY